MDLKRLEKDWEEDPQLKDLAFDSVEELANHLAKCHKMMMDGQLGCIGYLYKQQTIRARDQKQSGSDNGT